MKRILCLAVLVATFPLLAQARSVGCDPTGTWHGGTGWKYLATITPNGDGTYAMVFAPGWDAKAFGFTATSGFSSQVVRKGPRAFEARIIGFFVMPPSDDPNTPPALEMDIAHSFLSFKDGCDTMVNTIDFYGGYVPYTDATVPFVTPLDVNFLPDGATEVETYHRMKLPK